MASKEIKKITIYKGLRCPNKDCNGKLFSIYYRGFGKFKSLDGLYYCQKCDVVIKLNEENGNKIVIKK